LILDAEIDGAGGAGADAPPAALLGQRAAAIGNHLVTSQPGIITTALNPISSQLACSQPLS